MHIAVTNVISQLGSVPKLFFCREVFRNLLQDFSRRLSCDLGLGKYVNFMIPDRMDWEKRTEQKLWLFKMLYLTL